ncbi:apolipoprotein N-acyltransferase [candidate division WOR-1 bacterium RIFOXYA12_FULL_52_29]|uniref:Apolipoprotein N-acyltransferase n=1 Tax=candidate division WOR-1 bacterium RIFOXYC12_FULL_54_18 TaxID=1802584 RepID=A0A1F4T7Z2_UNCSA|nr:MAG: apolipoprotein N-acyltransferase [candidate division WOR-1 bacterium RIFOXYA2_FULL_51_19]OGC18243.1 MAG: apolipoprotein N-acyltransferase [candidate division WOR-1 bacterium RIFOXYA12_FULL_52_29]OGC27098.1 MAG: apolipoprotein N-acyltransferase [candidate division WOR-1 bacterium RIFOXYB2_FULL_45_9]OGC28660.1 MAG: apolipoprotein N-acyltransferase [candidate division WOR-1 bacterium RIFOXYC12_FULL_54_18]OGC30885.1 MAG: apolipoprotein N-acyltransferase [candidate division WOR-1 bacterium R
MSYILAGLSGILLTLSFPKSGLWWLAWVGLVPFFLALAGARTSREAYRLTLVFGLVYFMGVFFSITSLFRFGGYWIITGWLLLALFQSLFLLIFTGAFIRLGKRFRFAAVPFLWIGVEWLRGWGPLGVSIGAVGYSQTPFLPILQVASFAQVYGVSFLVVLTNVAYAQLILEPKRRKLPLAALFIITTALVWGNFALSRPEEGTAKVLTVALIQSNIDQFDRMNPRLTDQNYKLHDAMSRQAGEKIDLIVWPETAVFAYIAQNDLYLPKLRELAAETGAYLAVGTAYFGEGKRSYNSIVTISPSGEILSYYGKESLVPFGEYLPLRPLLYPLLRSTGYFDSEFSSDEKACPLVIGSFEAAGAVCFESTVPALIKKRVNGRTAFILTVTNDAWFGSSSAPDLHWQAGILRAVENRRYFVQLGNTGISGLIDPYGQVIKQSELNKREVVVVKIPVR